MKQFYYIISFAFTIHQKTKNLLVEQSNFSEEELYEGPMHSNHHSGDEARVPIFFATS